jgi:uncharacterized protein YdhG (YjbR/CyaY superfamily)
VTVATKDPSREAHFPAIEKKYGEKMSYWFKVMKEIADEKYPQQIAHLRENYGFSQAHANALVMYSRGSSTTKKYATAAEYYKTLDAKQVKTVKAIFKAIQTKFPELELVIAWNQPMLRDANKYVFGVSCSKNTVLLAPWSKAVLAKFEPKMSDLDVKIKTIGVPNDWKVDAKLLTDMVKMRMAEAK